MVPEVYEISRIGAPINIGFGHRGKQCRFVEERTRKVDTPDKDSDEPTEVSKSFTPMRKRYIIKL
jgi:hypothetical protein